MNTQLHTKYTLHTQLRTEIYSSYAGLYRNTQCNTCSVQERCTVHAQLCTEINSAHTASYNKNTQCTQNFVQNCTVHTQLRAEIRTTQTASYGNTQRIYSYGQAYTVHAQFGTEIHSAYCTHVLRIFFEFNHSLSAAAISCRHDHLFSSRDMLSKVQGLWPRHSRSRRG